jgi:rod shape determining protein RodA
MRILFRKLGQVGRSFPIIVALVVLSLASIFAIAGATSSNDALANAPASQAKYIVIGGLIFVGLALTPYKKLIEYSPILYGIGICLLVACFVPHIGKKTFGAYSWIRLGPIGFEPAEYAKIAYVLGLAWFLRVRENQIQSVYTVLMAFAIAAVPFILVLKQPALGTASVFFPVCFAMLWAAGARPHHLLIPLAAAAVLMSFSYYWFHVWDRPGYITVFNKQVTFLKEFQVDRIKIFFDPSLDTKGAGWQANQAILAIGSGGIDGKVPLGVSTLKSVLGAVGGNTEGKEWISGTQTGMGYLPRNTSYNDLIFSVVGELLGFRGGALLILFEGVVLAWCLWVAAHARDKIGALLAVGVMMMLFTHIFVNIGMTIQLVPITGIPLPFVSYGGSFLVACLAAMGLVQSVWVHRKTFDRT